MALPPAACDPCAYIAQDRARALAGGHELPDRQSGSVLFADIAGFTVFAEALSLSLGAGEGADRLTQHLDATYEALCAPLHAWGGVVISFAGDAMTCWFADSPDLPAAWRALLAAREMQRAAGGAPSLALADGRTLVLGLKIAIASGSVRRFAVGDPAIQRIDVLAGATVARAAAMEHHAQAGDTLIDTGTAEALGAIARVKAWIGEPGDPLRAGLLELDDLPQCAEPAATAPDGLAEPAVAQWLLDVTRERLLGTGSDTLAEVRPAVAVFIAFTGIDYEGEQAQQELDRFVRLVQNLLRDAGGTLLQVIIGDKGSYLFAGVGVHRAYEDDGRRAAQAALDLIAQVGDLAPRLTLRIGISRGRMHTGSYGARTRRTYAPIGDDVNLAARLMGIADEGEILVSGRVCAVLGEAFALEARPPLSLKGKAEPLPVFAVRGKQRQRAGRLRRPADLTPTVGRECEIDHFARVLREVASGQRRVLIVQGAAGIGKSRLVEEALRLAARAGAEKLCGVCEAATARTPYAVWKPVWQALFNLDPDAPTKRRARVIAAEVRERAPNHAVAAPLLAPLMDTEMDESAFTSGLEPRDRKGALHALLRELLQALAREAAEDGRSVIVALEDVHWIDPLSAELLDELIRAAVHWPVLFLLSARPNEVDAALRIRLDALPELSSIDLEPLADSAQEALVRSLLAQLFPERAARMPQRLLHEVRIRAQGNPFFANEYLRYARDRGEDPFAADEGHALSLPLSLQTLVLARVDRLDGVHKDLLQLTSVFGGAFPVGWLPTDSALPSAALAQQSVLQRLEAEGLLQEVAPGSWAVAHAIIQEALYASLPRARRESLHGRIGEHLESLSEGAARPLDALAYHYDRSANPAKRVQYLLQAADAAALAFSNVVAADYYRRLLPALRGVPGAANVRLRLARVLTALGHWQEAGREAAEALALAEMAGALGMAAECGHQLGILERKQGHVEAARARLGRALQQADAAGDGRQSGRILGELGVMHVNMGRFADAERLLDEARELAIAAADHPGHALALNRLGVTHSAAGRKEKAEACYRRSMQLARSLDDDPGYARATNNLAILRYEAGDYAAAEDMWRECAAIQTRVGDRAALTIINHNVALILAARGDYARARAMHREDLAVRRDLGDRPGMLISLTTLGSVCLALGDWREAAEHLREALTLAGDVTDRLSSLYALRGIASVLVAGQSPAAAARLVAATRTAAAALGAGINETLECRLFEECEEALRAGLDATTHACATREGARLTLEEAAAFAESELARALR